MMKARLLTSLLTTMSLAWALAVSAAEPPGKSAESGAPSAATPSTAVSVFAVVNGTRISAAEFDQAARTGFRQKFYHGKPPEAEVNKLLRETGQTLIDRVLLTEEIAKRQIAADKAAVDSELAAYEARYANSPAWKEQRDRALPQLRSFLEDKSKNKVLEDIVRKSATVAPEEVRRYYAERPDAFTEPEKVHVATILVKVDPSSPADVWKKAIADAEDIRKELENGADFAVTAQARSGDSTSSQNGGDLGYVHRGMLGDDVHAALDKIQVGQIIGPMRLLQGAALFKLIDRKTPQLQPFEKVAARAEGLVLREKSEKAWKDFLASLRRQAKIDIEPSFSQLMREEPASTKSN